ncbi:MAG: Hsp33 family molecular chaperone HslO, partial [Pseudomonadota bacterium]
MVRQQVINEVDIKDDMLMPFRTELSGISGRIVRLGPAVDDILRRHDYPLPIAEIMGEALALTALLGSQLKFDGKLILQTRSDGPLGFFVTDFQAPGK